MPLAFLPSPPSNAIHIGDLQLRAYGLAIALGVVAAVSISRRRWARTGGDPEDITTIATWAVPAGLVGARLYHVLTDYRRFEGRWLEVFAIWKGGLGIPGGLLAGVVTGVVIARRRNMSVPGVLDAVAPAIPVAQAIGRLGNYFNQELFGRPSRLPWAVRIDPGHRPDLYAAYTTFQPTFAYEALWNLALAALIVAVTRRATRTPGDLFVIYVVGYASGRLWVEALRVDAASKILGVRVNIWTSILALAATAVVCLVRHRRGRTLAGPSVGTDDSLADVQGP